jgi:hypothetical protein
MRGGTPLTMLGESHGSPYIMLGDFHVGRYLTDNEWKIFNRQRMLVIDGKYNNEDGMSTRNL